MRRAHRLQRLASRSWRLSTDDAGERHLVCACDPAQSVAVVGAPVVVRPQVAVPVASSVDCGPHDADHESARPGRVVPAR
jgi:hypothetical protein